MHRNPHELPSAQMFRAFAILFTTLGFAAFSAAAPDDRSAILGDTFLFPTTGAPGGVSVIGPNAFALIAGKEGKALSPVVAGTTWDKGRIIAFGRWRAAA